MQKFHAKLKIGCRASRDDCTSSHAAVGNCGSLDFRGPVVWTPDRKQSPWPFWPPALLVSRSGALSRRCLGRLRQCEIHDLRIAVEPGAGSFLAAPVELRIHHHVTPNTATARRLRECKSRQHDTARPDRLNIVLDAVYLRCVFAQIHLLQCGQR
jgi:hypothetical protein